MEKEITPEECSFWYYGWCSISKSECDIGMKEQRCTGPMIV